MSEHLRFECFGHIGSASCSCDHCHSIRTKTWCGCNFCERKRAERPSRSTMTEGECDREIAKATAELQKSIEWLNDQLQIATKRQFDLEAALALEQVAADKAEKRVDALKQAVEATLFGGAMPKEFDAEWLQQLVRRVREQIAEGLKEAAEEVRGNKP